MSTSWFRNRVESGLEKMLEEEGSGNQLLFLSAILRPPYPSVRNDKDFALVTGFRSHPILDPQQSVSYLLTPGLGAELWPEGASSKERGMCLGFPDSSQGLLWHVLRAQHRKARFKGDVITTTLDLGFQAALPTHEQLKDVSLCLVDY